MLRYKVYAFVTSPKFPQRGYYFSLLCFAVALFLYTKPWLLAIENCIQENAFTPQHQKAAFESESVVLKIQPEKFETYFTELDMDMKQWKNIYYLKLSASRIATRDCVVAAFPIDNSVTIPWNLLRYFKKNPQTWIGKDVVFIFYRDVLDLDAWLQEYHSDSFEIEYFGIIRQAVCIIAPETYDSVKILPFGFNGLMVDVDLLVGTMKIADKTPRIGLSLLDDKAYKEIGPWTPQAKYRDPIKSLENLLYGNVDKAHPYFLKYGIQSLTIEAYDRKTKTTMDKGSLIGLGKMLETMLRCFTAFDEQMHAGFYYYFQTRDTSFVPMKNYAYVIGGMILPLIFQAILLLFGKMGQPVVKEICITFATYVYGVGIYALSRYSSLSVSLTAASLGIGILFSMARLGASSDLLKAVSHIGTFLVHAVMGLFFLPLFLIVTPVTIPCKLFSQYKAVAAAYLVVIAIVVQLFWTQLEYLMMIDHTYGHNVWMAIWIGVLPTIYQSLIVSFI